MIALPAVVPTVPVAESDRDLFARLYSTWTSKRRRNLLRTVYYEGKNALKDFGIAVPPQMQRAFTPLQEIAKGVHAMTDRSEFEGFVTSSGSDDPFGLGEILDENEFATEFPMAITASAIHACSFLAVTTGDPSVGEPEYVLTARSAETSAAVWDSVRRALAGFLAVMAVDETGPTEMVMFTPDRVYSIAKVAGRWQAPYINNPLGEVSVVRLPFQPRLLRPFGVSRITRTAMGLTDAMVRTMLRAEVSAEFYSADKYWLFGADVTKFVGDDKWSALMGRMNAIDVDTIAGEKVDIQRFAGSSPQPHVELMRMFKSEFAEDQQLEVKWADASNPSSADAIYAAKEELIMKTRSANRIWGAGAAKAMRMIVKLRDGRDSTSEELRSLTARFTDPAIVSPSARADAFSKLSASIPGFGTSEVGMEFAGLSREQIARFKAEQQRASAGDRISQLVEAARSVRSGDTAADRGVPDGSADVGVVGAVADS